MNVVGLTLEQNPSSWQLCGGGGLGLLPNLLEDLRSDVLFRVGRSFSLSPVEKEDLKKNSHIVLSFFLF